MYTVWCLVLAVINGILAFTHHDVFNGMACGFCLGCALGAFFINLMK